MLVIRATVTGKILLRSVRYQCNAIDQLWNGFPDSVRVLGEIRQQTVSSI